MAFQPLPLSCVVDEYTGYTLVSRQGYNGEGSAVATTGARVVLLVEDEATLVAALRFNLEREGYTVLAAGDGEEGLRLAQREKPHLVLLDLMLPKLDGFEVCRALRRTSNVPVLILTARADEVDKVVGLELGADDYITKPFSMRELLARVRALLRRAEAPLHPEGGLLQSGGLALDPALRLASKNGQPLALKPKEFELLHFFLTHAGQTFTRAQLLKQVWGYGFPGGTRTVDVHVHWLREKIEDDLGYPVRLQTVRGVGYRFQREAWRPGDASEPSGLADAELQR